MDSEARLPTTPRVRRMSIARRWPTRVNCDEYERWLRRFVLFYRYCVDAEHRKPLEGIQDAMRHYERPDGTHTFPVMWKELFLKYQNNAKLVTELVCDVPPRNAE